MRERREPPERRHWSRLVGLRRRARGEGGKALVEFALVAMVFLLFVFGIIDFSRAYQSWVTVQHAAREGARYGVTGRTDCDIASPTRAGLHRVRGQAGHGWLYGAPNNVTVSVKSWEYPAYTTEHDGSAGNQCDALEVSVHYDFSLRRPLSATC